MLLFVAFTVFHWSKTVANDTWASKSWNSSLNKHPCLGASHSPWVTGLSSCPPCIWPSFSWAEVLTVGAAGHLPETQISLVSECLVLFPAPTGKCWGAQFMKWNRVFDFFTQGPEPTQNHGLFRSERRSLGEPPLGFIKWGNWGSDRGSDLPKGTQQAHCRAKNRTAVSWLSVLCPTCSSLQQHKSELQLSTPPSSANSSQVSVVVSCRISVGWHQRKPGSLQGWNRAMCSMTWVCLFPWWTPPQTGVSFQLQNEMRLTLDRPTIKRGRGTRGFRLTQGLHCPGFIAWVRIKPILQVVATSGE